MKDIRQSIGNLSEEKLLEIARVFDSEINWKLCKDLDPESIWDGFDLVPDYYTGKEGNIVQIDFRENISLESRFRFYDEGLWEHLPTEETLKKILEIIER